TRRTYGAAALPSLRLRLRDFAHISLLSKGLPRRFRHSCTGARWRNFRSDVASRPNPSGRMTRKALFALRALGALLGSTWTTPRDSHEAIEVVQEGAPPLPTR